MIDSVEVGVRDREQVLSRAAELAPLVRGRAAESEATRRVVDDVFDAIHGAGLTNLLLHESLGGLGMDPMTTFEAIETISAADGSTGWVTMIMNGSLMASWLEPATAANITGDGDFLLTGMFAPIGQARPDGDSFRVTGRWPFNSGSVHATWTLGGVMVMDGDTPRLRDDGMPDWRFALFPAGEAEIHDTWDASGLRATASHDVSVSDLSVPACRMIAPMFDEPHQPGPWSRFPFFAQLACPISAVPMGIARRALDEAVSLARTKSRSMGVPMIEATDVQNDLLRSEAQLRSARAFVLDAFGSAWDTASDGDPLSVDQRLSIRLASHNACQVSVDVVDRCFRIGGGGALYDRSPLQRCWRDVHAASHHIFFSDDHLRDYGGVWLGLRDTSLFM